MDNFFIRIKQSFAEGNILTKLIYINVGIFLLVRLAIVGLQLFEIDSGTFLTYLQLPSSFAVLLYRPWTLLTYMFLHTDFLHLLFNMLWLYWFGRIAMEFFNGRQLTGIYISGGIAGALMYMLAYHFFPYFRNRETLAFLMGASASVMAIVFAVSFYRKDYELRLMFIGRIRLLYLALFAFIIDFLSITSDNAGGHIAHIGGALWGMLFAFRFKQGKDLTVYLNRLIDRIVNLRKSRRPRMKVSYGRRPETDQEYRARKQAESQALDAILDKLKRSGYESLSAEEKKALFDASKK
ncbi:rhomboid family intramembrane serine protease [Tannerella sp.]|uniref:rhomboid family protein n=1 Tax=Tannerella sp. TaxID=2382127 RepID=UPI0026DB5A36|nr:rhomboid family intramembrane serine protease [Tannerella sp.]MDO4703477.1 rhomboid family intramembrane serine protease [Tannerella sp.]